MTVSPLIPPLRYQSSRSMLNALRGRGLRISTARRIVIQTLFDATRPLSAEEIAAGIAGQPPLDLASVYRNLERLEQLGAVRHLHAGHGPGRYALRSDDETEFLACERCRELTEVDAADLDEVRAHLRERFGYRVRFTHFPIVGLCRSCAEQGAGQ